MLDAHDPLAHKDFLWRSDQLSRREAAEERVRGIEPLIGVVDDRTDFRDDALSRFGLNAYLDV